MRIGNKAILPLPPSLSQCLRPAVRPRAFTQRSAVRVLWRLTRFEAVDGDALYRGVREVDWHRFIGPEGSLVVDAQASRSALEHTMFLAQRTNGPVRKLEVTLGGEVATKDAGYIALSVLVGVLNQSELGVNRVKNGFEMRPSDANCTVNLGHTA